MKKINKNNVFKILIKNVFCVILIVVLFQAIQIETKASASFTPSIKYKSHVANEGWQNYCNDGAVSGTVGKTRGIECIQIILNNIKGNVEYQSYLQDVGWVKYVKNGEKSGTTGLSRPIEAIRIRLTGDAAQKYDVQYRVHIENVGWLGWTSNNGIAGSTECALQMEAVQIKLVKKGTIIPKETAYVTKPKLSYKAHVGNIGWQDSVKEKEVAGTVGKVLPMEAIVINLNDFFGGSGIEYRVHMKDIGWSDWVDSGRVAGTTGQSRQIEAIQIQLKGAMHKTFDVFYRVHVKNHGWLGWAKNGEKAGTENGSLQMEAVQIRFDIKGTVAFGGGAFKYIPNQSPAQNKADTINWNSYVGRTIADINSFYYTSGNISYRGGYKGQCTWYAYGRFYEVNGIALKTAANAKYWLSQNSRDSRVSIVYSIQPKSIAVRTSGNYGHVIFVEEVTYSNGSPQYVYFTECNNDGNGRYDSGVDCIVKKLTYSAFCQQKKPVGYIVKR